MNTLAVLLILFFSTLCSCSRSARGESRPEKFSVGFWCWGEDYVQRAPSSRTADAMYVHAGSILAPEARPGYVVRRNWTVYHQLRENIPPASEYWIVFRAEAQGVPDPVITDDLIDHVWQLWREARLRDLPLAGIQLDVDSPTNQLRRYAAFLAGLRKRLPPGCKLSITALIDWFRGSTAIEDVVGEVDEFVPQFYDLAEPRSVDRQGAIAAKFDAARWGPVFNRLGKPFRIGISTFGRAEGLGSGTAIAPLPARVSHLDKYYADLSPLDMALNPAYRVSAGRNESGELVLDYVPRRPGRAGAAGGVEFIVATPESVRSAVESARKIGGRCLGVLFFRWPERAETLVMQPDEALAAAGVKPPAPEAAVDVEQVDGNCAAVRCADLYLVRAKPWAPAPSRYRIETSAPLEYFMPEYQRLVQMTGSSQLEATVPPYTGRRRVFLGRAVSLEPLRFTVETLQ